MECVVCASPVSDRAVRVDQYTCVDHLVHEECMERSGHIWRNPNGSRKRTGFQCPKCKATSPKYVSEAGASLNVKLKWIRISKEEMNADDPEIPLGAVLAGYEAGLEVYVARGRIRGDLVPGKWIPWTRQSFFPWGGSEHISQECEVLTCPSSDRISVSDSDSDEVDKSLKWVPSKNGESVPNAILGGYTSYGETLYVGRTVFGSDGDAICGKVHTSHKVLYFPYLGKELNQSHYEILIYDTKPEPK